MKITGWLKNCPLRMRAAALLLAALAATAPSAPGQVLNGQALQSLERPGVARELPPRMTARFQKTKGMLQPSARAWIEQQARSEAQKPAPDAAGVEAAVRARFGSCAGQPGARVNAVAVGAGASAAKGSQAGVCLAEMDIEELTFLVLMVIAQDAENDLRQSLAEMKAQNEKKQALRNMRQRINELENTLKAAYEAKSADLSKTPCDFPACLSLAELAGQLTQMTAQTKRPLRYNTSGQLSIAQVQQHAARMKRDLDSLSDMGEEQQLKLQQAMDRKSKLESTLSNLLKKMGDTQSSIIGNLK